MRQILCLFLTLFVGFGLGLVTRNLESGTQIEVMEKIDEKPLLNYTIENLGKRKYQSEIIMDEITSSQSGIFVQNFHFNSDGKVVTGLAHIPGGCDSKRKCSVIVQFRGYAENEGYQSGYGTWRSATEYAKAGFISLAPDFLGYGGSVSPEAGVFEARFETYTTALNLLSAVENWEIVNNIGLWGHSNGGQITITVLEVSGKEYPTVLWAPVTAGFPYSILFYMNNNEIGDRNLRYELAFFESVYDSEEFNPINYLDKIVAPIMIHQGLEDKLVPVDWNRDFYVKLKNLKNDVEYFEYENTDHNLKPFWDLVVMRDIKYFRKYFDN